MKLVTVILLALIASIQATALNFNKDKKLQVSRELVNIDGRNYFFSDPGTDVTYYDARNLCSAMNMDLISFETPDKEQNVKQYMLEAGNTQEFWTSGFRTLLGWYWIGLNKNESIILDNWDAGEPNEIPYDEACIVSRANQGWFDILCKYSHDEYILGYICEDRD